MQLKNISSDNWMQYFKLTPACLNVWRCINAVTVTLLLIGGYHAGNHLQNNAEKNEAVSVFYRTRLAANALRPVLRTNAQAGFIQNYLTDLTDGADMRLTVTDGSGNLIADTHASGMLSDLKESSEMITAVSGGWGHSVRTDHTDERIFFAIPIQADSRTQAIVRGGVSTKRLNSVNAGIRFALVSFVSLASLLIVIVSRISLGFLSNKLSDLEKQTDRVASGDIALRVSDEGSDEVANIGRNVNRLVSGVRDYKADAEIYKCRMKTIFDTAQEGYIVVNGDFSVLAVSLSAQRMTGSVNILKGNLLPESIRTREVESKIAEAMAFADPEPIELDFKSMGGSRVMVKPVGLKLHHKGSSAIIFLFEAVTNEKWEALESKLLPYWMKTVRKLDKNYKRLKSQHNHEQIESRASLAAEASLLQLKILTRNLGSWIRDEAASDPVKVSAVDPSGVLDSGLEILRPLSTLKQIQVENHLTACAHRQVLAQEHILKSALVHLLYRAVEFCPDQGVIRVTGDVFDGSEFEIRIQTSENHSPESGSTDDLNNDFLTELDRHSASKLLEPFRGKIEIMQEKALEISIKIPFVAPAVIV